MRDVCPSSFIAGRYNIMCNLNSAPLNFNLLSFMGKLFNGKLNRLEKIGLVIEIVKKTEEMKKVYFILYLWLM